MDLEDDDGEWAVCPELKCDQPPDHEAIATSFTNVRNERREHDGHAVGSSFGHTEFRVRATKYGPEQVEAILDSGSDVTVLPINYQQKGKSAGTSPVLRDAQGNELKGTSPRKVELMFEASSGDKIKVRKTATVAEAVRPPAIDQCRKVPEERMDAL